MIDTYLNDRLGGVVGLFLIDRNAGLATEVLKVVVCPRGSARNTLLESDLQERLADQIAVPRNRTAHGSAIADGAVKLGGKGNGQRFGFSF